MFYRQCELRRKQTRQVTWIPEKFAKRGKFLKLKNDEGSWEDGWEVIEVGERKPSDHVISNEMGYKKWRDVVDV